MTQAVATEQSPRPRLNGDRRVHQFTVDEYHRMIAAGILTGAHRVELLNGWIVDKMPQKPPHPAVVSRMHRWLVRVLPDPDWVVRSQSAVTLAASEPEPDLAIARGPDSRYELRHPGPRDLRCVMEVAESALVFDREEKGPIYAAARIPQYWVINLVDRCVEVFTRPYAGRNARYRDVKIYTIEDVLGLELDGKQYGELTFKNLLS
jgi:Uma2 family endonuclease